MPAESTGLIAKKGPPRLFWPSAWCRQVARYRGLRDAETEHQKLAIELAEAVDRATPAGALRTGIARLEALATEHPELQLGITIALKNLKEELAGLAAAANGGPRITARLRQFENDLRAGLCGPNIYIPTFPAPKPPRFPGDRAPMGSPSSG